MLDQPAGLPPAPTLPPVPVHLPFEAGPFRMAMGLLALEPDELIAIDENYPGEMAQRRALLAGDMRAEVLAAQPCAGDACTEVLELLADLLPRRFPAWFTRSGGRLENRLTGESWALDATGIGALELAGRLVQEDLCLLQIQNDVPVLTAAVLCFPSGWRLLDKLGLPLAQVHSPVPLYPDRLARPVDRLMLTLKAGKLVERVNWGVHDNPSLFRPGGHFRTDRNTSVTAENAGEKLNLRVERQTLCRLPRTESVLFGIHTYVYPLARIAADPAVAARLAAAVRALPPEMNAYKSVRVFAEPLLAYLDAKSAA